MTDQGLVNGLSLRMPGEETEHHRDGVRDQTDVEIEDQGQYDERDEPGDRQRLFPGQPPETRIRAMAMAGRRHRIVLVPRRSLQDW